MRRLTVSIMVAAAAVLACAGPANGETANGVATVAPENSVPTAQTQPVPAPEPVPVPESAAAPESAEPQVVTSASDSSGAGAESTQADSAPSDPPTSTLPSAAAVSSSPAAADPTEPSTSGVEVPARAETGVASAHRASGLVESVDHDSVKTIASVPDRATEVHAPPVPQLADAAAGPRILAPLLDPITQAPIESLGSLDGLSPQTEALGTASPEDALSFAQAPRAERPQQDAPARAGTLARRLSIGADGSLMNLEFGGVESVQPGTPGSSRREGTRRPATGSIGATYAGATTRHFELGSPSPSNVPQPAPESPGAIASGSGDSFFVPIAGLLVLLALAAPATFRRRGTGPDFPVPTQFVCALERPG
jgi:hypothetical protein